MYNKTNQVPGAAGSRQLKSALSQGLLRQDKSPPKMTDLPQGLLKRNVGPHYDSGASSVVPNEEAMEINMIYKLNNNHYFGMNGRAQQFRDKAKKAESPKKQQPRAAHRRNNSTSSINSGSFHIQVNPVTGAQERVPSSGQKSSSRQKARQYGARGSLVKRKTSGGRNALSKSNSRKRTDGLGPKNDKFFQQQSHPSLLDDQEPGVFILESANQKQQVIQKQKKQQEPFIQILDRRFE